jgi:uncharacterized protein YyaL (SSP411 family)
MHHNHAKNVLWVRAMPEEIASRTGREPRQVETLLNSAKKKMYAARLSRPIPYVDKTVYVSWNALCISAYLQAARVLGPEGDGAMIEARSFALRSLDRILSEAWNPERGLLHVIAYSGQDSPSARREVAGLLDDYAFTALACFEAYESTTDLTYFRFGKSIADFMIAHFYDQQGDGFFDVPGDGAASASAFALAGSTVGALTARRKPFQDSPTPAGDSAAAIALLRLYSLTHENRYRELATKTLEIFAGVAEQFGIYAGTYGLAAIWLARPYTQIVLVGGGPAADRLHAAAVKPFAVNKTFIHITEEEAVAAYLPPALTDSVPHLPGIAGGRPLAIVCSNFTCQPPVSDPDELTRLIYDSIRHQ